MGRLQSGSFGLVGSVLILAASLAGCGGGSGTPSGPTTLNGRFSSSDAQLQTGNFVQAYRATASDNGTATVDMMSSQVDSVLDAFRLNTDGTVSSSLDFNDDANSSTHDARISFPVSRGSSYVVAATTYNSNATGSFTLVFSSNLNNISRFTPSRSAAGANPQSLLQRLQVDTGLTGVK